MLGWLVKRRLDAYERSFNYDTSYIRDIYAASPRAFWRFSKFLGLSTYREGAPSKRGSRQNWWALSRKIAGRARNLS